MVVSLRKNLIAVVLGLLSICASPRSVDVQRLKGAWFGDGPSFELVVRDRTILFELDMKEHAYRIDGDVLIIAYDDGEQRHRIVRLTDEEMEWESEATATRSVFHRKGAWEQERATQTQPNGEAPPRRRVLVRCKQWRPRFPRDSVVGDHLDVSHSKRTTMKL